MILISASYLTLCDLNTYQLVGLVRSGVLITQKRFVFCNSAYRFLGVPHAQNTKLPNFKPEIAG
ncbi:hypothetical protein WA026_010611, partial [Henosepilachna vigintioctopunctata]